MSSSFDSPIQGTAETRVRWLLVWWIALTGAVSYLDRVNLSIAGQRISDEFHFSQTQLGLVFGAFSVGYGLFQIGGGWAADRFGPRRVLAFGALWWAIATTLTTAVPMGVAGALVWFWTVRFLLGMGESVMYPSSNRWVANWVPVEERGLANGIIFAGVGAGAAFTPPVIATLMQRHGWRAAFWACAAAGLLVGAAWYLLARDHPDSHPWVNEAERRRIREGIERPSASEGSHIPWATLLQSKDVWAITFSYFCYGYVVYIFFTWFFIYLTTVRGLNLKVSSYYATLPFLAMATGSILGGLISDGVSRRFGRRWGRCGVAVFGLGAAAAFVVAGSLAQDATTASIVLAGGAGALYLSQSSYWALSADLGGKSSGSLSGLMNMGAQTGSAITAALTPVIAQRFGWNASFLVAAAFCALGGLAWLLVDPDQTLQPSQLRQ